MKRRQFLTSFGGIAVTWPIAALAQQGGRMRHVIVWIGDVTSQHRAVTFRDAMGKLGWVDNRNVKIDVRFPTTNTAEETAVAAAGIAELKPDVIVTAGAPLLGALQRVTKTVPIVFTLVTDPVGDGFVASLSRPGGNITGFTIFEHSFAGKWLEILKEAVPGITRVAVMQNSDHPAFSRYLQVIGTVASGMGVEVIPAPINSAPEIVAAVEAFARVPNGALVLLPSPVVTAQRDVIASFALRHGLPSIYLARAYAMSGGLMSYGVDLIEPFRQAASYVDRILKGARPEELPVQAASKFEMVINLKTAKMLGITVPPSLLARADEVIE